MVPPSKKRKVPPTTGPEPKRSKNLAKANTRLPKAQPKTGGKGKNRNETSASTGRAVVDSSSLAWQSVGEDFGGLQVLSGVDVVKNGGTVQFVVKNDSKSSQPAVSDDEDEGESFEGFGDDVVASEPVDSGEAGDSQDSVEGEKPQEEISAVKQGTNKSAKAQKSQKQSENDTNKKGKQQKIADKKLQKPSAHGAGNEFLALAEMADGEAEDDLDMGDWVALNLSPSLVSAIAKLGFAKPTAIQQKSIPEIIAGGDVIGKAQTGSGKTLAFGLPIVEKWLEMHEGQQDDEDDEQKKKRTGPMAVVLSPTRELAKQIGDHIKAVCDGLPTSPYVCVVTGGLSIQKQQRQLEKADIVVGTPGRLWEVLDGDAKLQRQFTRIDFLVVDEADRLFKVGQFKEAENIIGALDGKNPEADDDDDEDSDSDAGMRRRQTLVFSATFDKNLQTKLAGKGRSAKAGSDEEKMEYLMKCLKFRTEPKFIDVNPVSRMADNLREGLIECGAMEKDLYLYSVLLLNPGRRTLVFTNSISAVRRITPLLQHLNLNALPLHSQMIQKARLRSLEKFTAARNTVLVATDVAARGLDIKEVDQVIHYHVPRAADTYIHRSGRTARADRSGVSIILCSPDEVLPTRRLASKVHAERASGKKQHFIESLPIDRKIACRLKPRLDLAKKITDAILAKEKAHSNDTWLRNAAEDLGVEYDSEEFEATASSGWAGGSRGGGRRRKEKEAKALTKAEMGALKAQLRQELSQRVNLGVSERYITGGRVDIAQLLKERENTVGGIFLGGDNLGLGLGL